MTEQLDYAQSNGSHRSRNVFTAVPPFLLEAELEKEGERPHRQDHAENSSVSSVEEEFVL